MACGSGHNSEALLKHDTSVDVMGFDISTAACEDYRQRTGRPAAEADITLPWQGPVGFDVVFIIGGLHHCANDLPQVLDNVAMMLKPGGIFLMQEPNARFFLEKVRQVWYRKDPMFDQNEAALRHDALLAQGQKNFTLHSVEYSGGPAYFIVLQSMIMRVPLGMKPYISPPLIMLERLWNKLPSPVFHNTFQARWHRT